MGYPIDGDDDFLIKLLFRLFGKTISVIFLGCSWYLNKMQALFYVSEPIKGIILLTLQHQYN